VADGGSDSASADADVEVDSGAIVDAPPDVPADAPRVWCVDSVYPDGGGMFCPPGMICGNSGGVPGNSCCYQQEGAPDYYCP